ncbi:MAG: hypothetical protein OXF67_09085 [Cyanobacteria bacterium MAG CAR4_bin_6]|nr:hypothetical protein [Cyanobacteria bacterium MAG CAR4_bin_6]
MTGCIDLIYLDPPFNKNKKFTAPIGSSADGAEFSDIFREEDVKDEWLVTIREDQTPVQALEFPPRQRQEQHLWAGTEASRSMGLEGKEGMGSMVRLMLVCPNSG